MAEALFRETIFSDDGADFIGLSAVPSEVASYIADSSSGLAEHERPHLSQWTKRVDGIVIDRAWSIEAPGELIVQREARTDILKVHTRCGERDVCVTLRNQRVLSTECTCEAYKFGGGIPCKHGVRVLQAISNDEYVPPEEEGEELGDAMDIDYDADDDDDDDDDYAMEVEDDETVMEVDG